MAQERPTLKICVCEGGTMPKAAHPTDAGLDIYAAEDVIIRHPGRVVKVKTALFLEIPTGHYVEITGRSGLSLSGLVTVTGTVDEDYRGEIGVLMYSADGDGHKISKGDRIAQMIMHERITPMLEMVNRDELSQTERGVGGFGSTGA